MVLQYAALWCCDMVLNAVMAKEPCSAAQCAAGKGRGGTAQRSAAVLAGRDAGGERVAALLHVPPRARPDMHVELRRRVHQACKDYIIIKFI